MGLLFLLTIAFGWFLIFYEKLQKTVREKDAKESKERWKRLNEWIKQNEQHNLEKRG